ncbi:MAG: amidohydrolase family protein [Bacteroidetes bacterium]|nr:amidohydrolase family protein [Bacteroidota bacterium]
MTFLKWKPTRLFDGQSFRENNAVLITRADGTVENIIAAEDAGDEIQELKGILSPGFINCHCHLELSHLKDVIPPHTGLIEFLCSVVTKRGFSPDIVQEAIVKAEKEMYDNGIVGVGDIGNTADTALVKSRSLIYWQNFTEVLGFTDEKAAENMAHYSSVAAALQQALSQSALPHRTSLVPHAPYSISPDTFRLINALTENKIISLHNQEHPAEDDLYKTGGGEYLKFFRIFGMNGSPLPVTGMSSIRSVLPYFNKGQTILLVHNSYMPEEDIVWANAYAAQTGLTLIYCLCINANLYIENHVPPVALLMKHHCKIVLGTDSYSSNWQLSITSEIASLRKHLPDLPEATILQWATGNGASALQWQDTLGSFASGKKPGLALIDEDYHRSVRLL